MPDTAKAPRGPANAEPEGTDLAKKEAMVREMLGRVADKWTLLVIEALSSGGELGESLGESVCGIWLWVEAHLDDVERSRRAFDQDKPKASGRP